MSQWSDPWVAWFRPREGGDWARVGTGPTHPAAAALTAGLETQGDVAVMLRGGHPADSVESRMRRRRRHDRPCAKPRASR